MYTQYIYICIYTHIYIYMYTDIYIYMYIDTHAHLDAHLTTSNPPEIYINQKKPTKETYVNQNKPI